MPKEGIFHYKNYEKLTAKEIDFKEDGREIQIAPSPHLGNVVIEAEGLSKAYGENVLFENVEFKIPPGGIVGVIGPNGSGKTTLFDIISEKVQPDSGTLTVGKTVALTYVDQHRDEEREEIAERDVEGAPGRRVVPLAQHPHDVPCEPSVEGECGAQVGGSQEPQGHRCQRHGNQRHGVPEHAPACGLISQHRG